MPEPLKLIGVPGSPYSRKMRAVLRYRRIAFDWVLQNSAGGGMRCRTPKVPVDPGDRLRRRRRQLCREVMTDSSPQIMRLEAMFDGRSVVPTDPVVAFVDYAARGLRRRVGDQDDVPLPLVLRRRHRQGRAHAADSRPT